MLNNWLLKFCVVRQLSTETQVNLEPQYIEICWSVSWTDVEYESHVKNQQNSVLYVTKIQGSTVVYLLLCTKYWYNMYICIGNFFFRNSDPIICTLIGYHHQNLKFHWPKEAKQNKRLIVFAIVCEQPKKLVLEHHM